MRRVLLGGVLAMISAQGCNCGLQPLEHILQPGDIVGRVCDPGEGQGLYGADVYVVTPQGTRIATVTDGNGDFDLTDVPVGTYTVHVERGSFKSDVDSIVVAESTTTTLDQAECIKPAAKQMLVISGHDSVENVLARIGEFNFVIIDSHFHDHTASTSSWFVDQFQDLATIQENQIVFINCGPHEWALDDADPTKVATSLANLRTYVAQGGSLYISDWAYDILDRLYPDAAHWYGDGSEDNAQAAIVQTFTGNIQSADLQGALGRNSVNLSLEQGQVAVATSLGPNATALITATVDVKVSTHQTETLTNVPVLFEVHPADAAPDTHGRVIYTSFHNGPTNTSDMDDVLRAIVFSL